jgi:Fur family transcriptional regulator, ferric uptake regulator
MVRESNGPGRPWRRSVLAYPDRMDEDPHTIVADRLHRGRQRYTAGRRALVNVLLGAGRPLTIAELLRDGDGWSQSSIYRNLGILETCGIVVRLSSTDGLARFEVTEELSHHHHHLVCSSCGRLDDVELPDRVEATLHAVTAQAGKALGYEVDEHRLELIGRCSDCR